MAVPQTWVTYRDYERDSYEPREFYDLRMQRLAKDLRKRLRHHYEIALSDPRFVAFIPFLWSFEPVPGKPDNIGFGADQFEWRFPQGGDKFMASLEAILYQVKTAEYAYPNLSRKQTEFSLYRPQNRYEVEILSVGKNGRVNGWAINRALPHKNLRMQLALEHNGEEVYASGLKRSFIHGELFSPPSTDNLPILGAHGYRHKIPKGIVRDLRGESVVIKLRVYGDRAKSDDYHEVRQIIVF